MRTWDDPNERVGTLAALMTQSHPQHEAALYNLFSALESPGEPDFLYALGVITALVNSKREDAGIPQLDLLAWDGIRGALQTELAQALSQVRDLELQRDCLMRALADIRALTGDPPAWYGAIADDALAYLALTPQERAKIADERAALDAISLDSVEEIPY